MFGPSKFFYWKPGASYNSRQYFQVSKLSMMQPRLPFLATLHFSNLSKLVNNSILHDPSCPTVPTKLPLDIPKFEGKSGEDPHDHVMMFHLCSHTIL
jgi:hypothetical protein